MCRPKELGGRRCPQHTDPVKHAAYNARRRELYHISKNDVSTAFPLLDSVRLKMKDNKKALQRWTDEQMEFTKKINPSYTPESWESHRDDTSNWQETQSEADAILHYSDYGYKRISRYFNDQNSGIEPEEIEPVLSQLDSALSKADRPEEPRLLYRGVHLAELNNADWVDRNFPVGKVISQKNYMSTSFDPEIGLTFAGNGSLVLEILSKQGAPIGEGLSYYGSDEHEVLMPRETKFKVVAVHHGVSFKVKDQSVHQQDQTPHVTVVQLVDADNEETGEVN
jgi:hypothetical protein